MFLYIILILAVISVFLALNSLRKINKHDEIESVKKTLSAGKVIFKEGNYSSSSDKS